MLRAGLAGLVLMLLAAGDAAGENRTVKQFGKGSGPGQVGVIGGTDESPVYGPQAIAATGERTILLLDQVNRRLLRWRAGGETQALPLPADIDASDLVVADERIVVWDEEPVPIEERGGALQRLAGVPATYDEAMARSLFAQMGSEPPVSPTELLRSPAERLSAAQARPPRRQQVPATRAGGPPFEAEVRETFDGKSVEIAVKPLGSDQPPKRLKAQVRDRLGTVEVLRVDAQGRVYVLVENIPDNAERLPLTLVVRFAENGPMDAIYDLPLEETATIPRRFVAVSPEGQVFFLRLRQDGADVVEIGAAAAPGEVRLGEVRTGAERARRVAVEPIGVLPDAAGLRSAEQMIRTALQFETVTWKVTEAARGTDPDPHCTGFDPPRQRRPIYLARANGEAQGVPYAWGGRQSLADFLAAIGGGKTAGNVCTQEAPKAVYAGVDCSGFINEVWGLNGRFTTRELARMANAVPNPWELKPGDALNKPGAHAMLFLRFTPDRKVEVIEAAATSCKGRVCRNVYVLSSLLRNGYSILRYRGAVS